MTKTTETSSRETAFGCLAVKLDDLRERINGALNKARDECHLLAKPTRKKFPLDRLRRYMAKAMCLETIFSPRFVEKNSRRYPNSRMPINKLWDLSPVWKTAPTTADRKARRLSSLLHIIVAYGWRAPTNVLVRDLTRLSINVWSMSLRDFYGLCRKIFTYIVKCGSKSPDPVLRFGALSTNPILRMEKFLEPTRISCLKDRFGVSHLPKSLGLALSLKQGLVAQPLLRRST